MDKVNWEERKQQVLDYIRTNSGKYNGSEITYDLNLFSKEEYKIIDGHYVGYLRELSNEHKIKYDQKEEKWYAMTTLDVFL